MKKKLTEYGKFNMGEGWRGGLARSTKKFNLKTRLFYGKGGGGLTQSIKSLTEKGNENPYFQYREGGSRKCGVFPHSVSF